MGNNRNGLECYQQSGWSESVLIHAIETHCNTYQYTPPPGYRIRLRVYPDPLITWNIWAFVEYADWARAEDDRRYLSELRVSFYDQQKELEALAMLKDIKPSKGRTSLKIKLFPDPDAHKYMENPNPVIQGNTLFYDIQKEHT